MDTLGLRGFIKLPMKLILKFEKTLDVNLRTHTGSNALMEACSSNEFKIVKLLLSFTNNIEINAQTYKLKNTALMIACRENHLKIITLLLKYNQKLKIDVNIENCYGENALTCALKNRQIEVIKLFPNYTNMNDHYHHQHRDEEKKVPLILKEKSSPSKVQFFCFFFFLKD